MKFSIHGALFAIVMATVGALWATHEHAIARIESVTMSNQVRISVVEAQYKDITDRLKRIEDKIDEKRR